MWHAHHAEIINAWLNASTHLRLMEHQVYEICGWLFFGGWGIKKCRNEGWQEGVMGVEGHPAGGWDRTALCTSNVCHSSKLMMPHSWANHPPAACEKRETEIGDWGCRVLAHGNSEKRWDALVRWGGVAHWWKFRVWEHLWQSTPHLALLSDTWMIQYTPHLFFSSQLHGCLLPSSACFIESNY